MQRRGDNIHNPLFVSSSHNNTPEISNNKKER